MKNEQEKELQQIIESLKIATWIGEDGNAVVNASTEEEALEKFKKLMRDCVGDKEAEEMLLENVGIGWIRLTTEEEKKQTEDSDWVVSYEPSKGGEEIFVYYA